MICISSLPQIRQRAYEIFQERLQTGRKGDASSDWLEAENEIRRHGILARALMLHLYPKPTTLPWSFRGFRPQPSRLYPESIRQWAVA